MAKRKSPASRGHGLSRDLFKLLECPDVEILDLAICQAEQVRKELTLTPPLGLVVEIKGLNNEDVRRGCHWAQGKRPIAALYTSLSRPDRNPLDERASALHAEHDRPIVLKWPNWDLREKFSL